MTRENSKELRSRILGVLLREARIRSGFSADEVANVMHLAPSIVYDFEFGRQSISLPQLEILSIIYRVPISSFWSDKPPALPELDFIPEEAIVIRRRIIGVLIQQARLKSGRSLEELAEFLRFSAEEISNYEYGESDMSVVDLQAISSYLGMPFEDFLADGLVRKEDKPLVPIGSERQDISALPEDLHEFLVNPINSPYLRLAMKLSELPADTLRSIGEQLLDITY